MNQLNRVLAVGFLAVLLAEIVGVMFNWRLALPVAGVAVAVFGLQISQRLAQAGRDDAEAGPDNDALEALLRWKGQTEELIRWADTTRGDWDRHLRPRLARDFLVATKQKEPAAVASTGRLVFGDELWQWVDPQNVSSARRHEPAPGRDALEQILRRLEDV
ncbi:MAG: hypothetical protein ACKOQ4_09250 [Mycobacterium sp.]